MLEMPPLNEPWLVTTWPGMGGVALAAGDHLVQELGMEHLGDLSVEHAFEVTHLAVTDGVARLGELPRCAVYLWRNPGGGPDLVLLQGEAQPATGAYALAREVTAWAREWGVVRVLGFAAMASQMHPRQEARVFGAASGAELLRRLQELGAQPLEEGQVMGLNGLLVAAAQAGGVEAACLLGELPYFATQVENPKAAGAVLQVFQELLGHRLDLTSLQRDAEEVDRQLTRLLERMEESGDPDLGIVPREEVGSDSSQEAVGGGEEDGDNGGIAGLSQEARERIERLFQESAQDRSKAVELKRELDRLGVFSAFENRFLDLFKSGE